MEVEVKEEEEEKKKRRGAYCGAQGEGETQERVTMLYVCIIKMGPFKKKNYIMTFLNDTE